MLFNLTKHGKCLTEKIVCSPCLPSCAYLEEQHLLTASAYNIGNIGAILYLQFPLLLLTFAYNYLKDFAMIKQVVALVLISVVLTVGMNYAQPVVERLLDAHDWLAEILTNVFSGGQAGSIIRDLIALLAVPLIIGLVPTLIYWMVKRTWFPYFMQTVWIVWLVEIGALTMMYDAVI
jgi:hypothetical protein